MLGFRIIGGTLTGVFGLIGLIMGFVCLLLSIVFFFPLLGWGNWIVIPLAVVSIIFSGIASANPDTRWLGNAGVVMAVIAIILGIVRLAMGHGII